MDIEQIYTIKDQFVIHSDWWIDWFEIDWLIDWALVSQIYLVQQDEEHGHYFFIVSMVLESLICGEVAEWLDISSSSKW